VPSIGLPLWVRLRSIKKVYGPPALGRFDPSAKPSPNDRYLRIAHVHCARFTRQQPQAALATLGLKVASPALHAPPKIAVENFENSGFRKIARGDYEFAILRPIFPPPPPRPGPRPRESLAWRRVARPENAARFADGDADHGVVVARQTIWVRGLPPIA
jgi:hypothetical protein